MSARLSSLNLLYSRSFAALAVILAAPACTEGPSAPLERAARYLVTVNIANPLPGTAVTVTAQVVDADDDPLRIAGLTVFWRMTDDDHVLSQAFVVTGGDGSASVTLTTSPVGGFTHTVTAAGSGLYGTSPPITTLQGPPISFVALANGLGNVHSCAVANSGMAYCWGNNSGQQLGSGGSAVDRPVPVPVSGNRIMSSLSGGWAHTCASTESGAAYCWGSNEHGALGDNSTASRPGPVPVAGGLSFTSVSAGFAHTCGVTAGGAAYCWGANGAGQLGIASSGGSRTAPTAVGGGLTFAALSAGQFHTCGVATDGAAYCWGSNASGQLGDNSIVSRSVPVLVAGGLSFASVSTGSRHTCGRTTAGAAYCWGNNSRGQLGSGVEGTNSNTPRLVSGGFTFTAVNAGGGHSCGVIASGAAYCWGSNDSGELGSGTNDGGPTPQPVGGSLRFRSLTAGGIEFDDYYYSGTYFVGHSCGLTTDGVAYCWGSNTFGELGSGLTNSVSLPRKVSGQQ